MLGSTAKPAAIIRATSTTQAQQQQQMKQASSPCRISCSLSLQRSSSGCFALALTHVQGKPKQKAIYERPQRAGCPCNPARCMDNYLHDPYSKMMEVWLASNQSMQLCLIQEDFMVVFRLYVVFL
jgi:hypothetical protein